MNRSYEDKALDGLPDKRRQATPDIQTPDIELPAPPEHLTPVAKKLWLYRSWKVGRRSTRYK